MKAEKRIEKLVGKVVRINSPIFDWECGRWIETGGFALITAIDKRQRKMTKIDREVAFSTAMRTIMHGTLAYMNVVIFQNAFNDDICNSTAIAMFISFATFLTVGYFCFHEMFMLITKLFTFDASRRIAWIYPTTQTLEGFTPVVLDFDFMSTNDEFPVRTSLVFPDGTQRWVWSLVGSKWYKDTFVVIDEISQK